MYNPHARPDYANEAALMGKGRLIKARLVDQDIPNVSWFWIQTGNCFVCKYFAPDGTDGRPKCLNKKISHKDFMDLYIHVNTCPQFEHGTNEQSDGLDVMKAAGIVEGEPSQEIEIIVNEPWSIDLAKRAHQEQSYFMDMAAQVDAGGDNSMSRGEYVDMTDDLERESDTAAP